MRTQEGYEIRPMYVASSVDDFCSLRIEDVGKLNISIYPVNSDELRHLAAELTACADRIDGARADSQRVRDVMFDLAMAADEGAAP